MANLPQALSPGGPINPAVKFTARRKARDRHGEALLRLLVHVARRGFGLSVWQWAGHTSPVSGHSQHSMHNLRWSDGTGKAFDAYGSARRMRRFAAWVDRYAPQVDEGIHNPNLSRKNGKRVLSSYWGSETWLAHLNHVHIGNDGPGR